MLLRRVLAILTALILGVGLSPTARADCSTPIYEFFYHGANEPNLVVGTPAYHTGSVGCTSGSDTFYVVPGAMFTNHRLTRSVSVPPYGCVLSDSMVNGGWCGQMILRPGLSVGSQYAVSPYVSMDPTRTNAFTEASVENVGKQSYRPVGS